MINSAMGLHFALPGAVANFGDLLQLLNTSHDLVFVAVNPAVVNPLALQTGTGAMYVVADGQVTREAKADLKITIPGIPFAQFLGWLALGVTTDGNSLTTYGLDGQPVVMELDPAANSAECDGWLFSVDPAGTKFVLGEHEFYVKVQPKVA